jgi:hypothetical protein
MFFTQACVSDRVVSERRRSSSIEALLPGSSS